MIERQCAGWGAAYMVLGPFGLRVTSQTDPVVNRVVSVHDRARGKTGNGMIIWMDGRPRPSEHALHTQAGFTVGRWEGGALAARTTHVKAGFIRKTGVPLTDQATIDWRFFRHGDVLTVPYGGDRSRVPRRAGKSSRRAFGLSRTPLDYRAECVTAYEGREPGDSVPHYAPDQNPFADEFVNLYHLPREAVLGYREDALSGVPEKDQGHLRPSTTVQPHPVGLAGNFVLRQ